MPSGCRRADRRARLVRVTGRGREITAAGLEIVDRMHQQVLDALPPSQRDAFIAAMNTLVGGYLASEPVGLRPPGPPPPPPDLAPHPGTH